MAALAWAGLPESAKSLAARGDHVGAAKILSVIAPQAGINGSVTFTVHVWWPPGRRFGVSFAGGRPLDTILLWVVFVINFLVIYFLFGWMPSLFSQAGQSASNVILAAALFNLGGYGGGAVHRVGSPTGSAPHGRGPGARMLPTRW